jgi:hypothetical protein
VELEEVREHVLVVQPSRSVMEISNALIDLGMFPIQDIPVHPKSTQDVLTAASLVLERLQEEHAPMPVPGSETRLIRCCYNPKLPRLPSFFAFVMYVMYISIFLHMLMYKDI